jgi:hypothetical protein
MGWSVRELAGMAHSGHGRDAAILLDWMHIVCTELSMFDRIFEMIEMFLVNLGLAMNRMSAEEKKTVSVFLASLMVAAIASRVLQAAFVGH